MAHFVASGYILCQTSLGEIFRSCRHGTFKGREEIGRYFRNGIPGFATTETELIVQGNKAAHEYVIEGATLDGMNWRGPRVDVYQFRNGIVQQVHGVYDRLSIAKQGTKGMLAVRNANAVIKQMEETTLTGGSDWKVKIPLQLIRKISTFFIFQSHLRGESK